MSSLSFVSTTSLPVMKFYLTIPTLHLYLTAPIFASRATTKKKRIQLNKFSVVVMGRYVYIQNTHSGLVLDVKGANSKQGTSVIAYPYNGNANQLWEIQGNTIYSVLNRMVLDIKGPSNQGQPLIVWPHNNGLNQKWHFDSDGTIRSGNGLVLDINKANFNAGTSIIGWPKNCGLNQKWRVVHV